ncbi:MAG: histidine phosphatase family protein [Telluria sp.]
MTEIILIRHGETDWNAARRLQGHTDIALNAAGRRQAEAMGAALASERIDVVVASDLSRARDTAVALARRHGLPVQVDTRLRERCYGAFEGLLYTEIAARYPDAFASWQARDADVPLPPGERPGESFRAFFARTTAAIQEWAARHPGRRLAIVAHGGVLECAYRAAQGLALDSPRSFGIPNAAINRFVSDAGALRLVSWGETAHLEPAPSA